MLANVSASGDSATTTGYETTARHADAALLGACPVLTCDRCQNADDALMQLCSGCQELRITRAAESSCSSTASLAETVSAQTRKHFKRARADTATSRSLVLPHKELGYEMREDDESSDMDSSDGEQFEPESWLADHCDAAHYQRFELVDLVLPASMGGSSFDDESQRFWVHTASNLEILVELGLVERYSLVVRSVNGVGLVEVEMDASKLRGACVYDVCGLRIFADVDTLRAHCADCPRCTNKATEEWSAWWSKALCLAEYTSFPGTHTACAHDMMCDNKMQFDCDSGSESGFDLSFLGT